MGSIRFVQGPGKGVDPFEKEFDSFDEVREWVLKDKECEYGDVLSYGGTFVGLTQEQVAELENLTLEDVMKNEEEN